jgi:LysM repeat protein
MRKTALFSSLVVALATLQFATAQDLYIRFDAGCVEKLEYRFVEQENGIAYSAYKVNKNATENLYFETGVEVPQVRKAAPSKMVTCNALNLDRSTVVDINTGRRKAFIVKKLDSGWAYLPVGSAAHMSFADNILTYIDATSDFQADVKSGISGNDLSKDDSETNPKAAVFYIGEIAACNFTAYQFKKTPRMTCLEDATIAILPGLGLIQDFATSGQRFELVGINNTDVCGYYATPTTPEPIIAEPQPDVPQSYNVITQNTTPYSYGENPPSATEYVEPPTVVYNDVTKSDYFGESTNPEVPQSYNTVAAKSTTDAEPEPACLTIATEGEHVVQRGESLYGIARRYGLSVNSLREWNDVKEDVIFPCSPLKITAPIATASMEEKRQNDVPQSYNTMAMPKAKPVAAPVEEVVKVNCNVEASEGEHVVLQGESLYAIARTYNLKVDQLKAWNSLSSDKIMLCQKLLVVAPAQEVEAKSVPTEYATVAVKKSAGPKVEFKSIPKSAVVVKAKSVAPKAVAKPKKVEPFMAKTVTITAKSVPVKQTVTFVKKGAGLHVVQRGETIIGLAKESNMTESEFRKLNNLGKGETITVGQVLRMENCACNVSVDADNSLALKPIPIASDIIGDVPASYNTVVRPKKVANTEGVELTAKSVERTTRKYHVVQQTETLYSIAKTYGKKVEDIRTLNRLDDNEVLVPNQLLILE